MWLNYNIVGLQSKRSMQPDCQLCNYAKERNCLSINTVVTFLSNNLTKSQHQPHHKFWGLCWKPQGFYCLGNLRQSKPSPHPPSLYSLTSEETNCVSTDLMEGYVLIQQPSNITTPATLIKNNETKMTSLIITKCASQMSTKNLK